jgi:L-threonylcarbamoyladenylate synthase
MHARPAGTPARVWQVVPGRSEAYARMLYATLRELDRSGCVMLIVEAPPQTPGWLAVNDRLRRSAAGAAAAADEDSP